MAVPRESLSDVVCRHVAGQSYEALSPKTRQAAKRVLLDATGVIAAASGLSTEVAPFVALARASSRDGPCTLLGFGDRLQPPMAAFANGAMAPALDFEDAFDGAPCHPNAAAVPAIADGGVLVTVRGWHEPVERGIRVFPVLVATAITETAKLEKLRDQAEAGVLTPRVAKVLPASQAAEAHRILERGGVRGRLVLDFTTL